MDIIINYFYSIRTTNKMLVLRAVFTFSHSGILAKVGNICLYYDTFTARVADTLVLT